MLIVIRPLLHCVVGSRDFVVFPVQLTLLARRIVTDINAMGVVIETFKKITVLYHPRHMLDLISTTFLHIRHSALLLSTRTWNIPLLPPRNFEATLNKPQLEYVRGTSPLRVQTCCPLYIYSLNLALDYQRIVLMRYSSPKLQELSDRAPNDPWIERGVYRSRTTVCIVPYLRLTAPH